MIELMDQTGGDLVAVRCTGKLTDQDYKEVFIPALESALAGGGKIRALLLLDERFQGWDAHAMWDDAKFGMAHRNDFSKIAVAGGARWIEWGLSLASHFMQGQVKSFETDQSDQALAWLDA